MSKTRFAIVIPPLDTHSYKNVGIKQSLPHIGVAYLAANIDSNQYEIRVYDCPALHMSAGKLASELKDFSPHAVGFTAMTLQINDAHETARVVKATIPEAIVIIGGYHVSAVPTETLDRFPEFDIGVCGEGEDTTNELLAAIKSGNLYDDIGSINGLCYRRDGATHLTPERKFNEDLDSFHFPAYEYMPVELYAGFYSFFMASRRTLPISTGRGCPFKCIFCYKATGNKYRTRSIESVMDEVRRDIRDFQVRELVITDESFLMYHERVHKLCNAILEQNLQKKISWICQSRVDHAKPETLKLMKRSGCRVISYGIESGNPEMLKTIKKGITIERAVEAIKHTRQAGILTDTNFIFGHPGDTRETIRETIDFSIKLDAHMASFALLVPFPGTEVARMARNGEGGLKLLSSDYSKYGKQVGSAMELDSITRTELERFHRKAYIRFYLRPSRFINLFRVVDIKMMLMLGWHTIVSKLRIHRED